MSLREDFPIIPHESAGVDCCGCIVPTPSPETGNTILRCNECGAVVGTISTGILNDLVKLIP